MARTPPATGPLPPVAAADAPTYGDFIGGEWRPSVTGRTFASLDPADDRDVVGHFHASSAADVAAAVRAAGEAFPAWRRTPAPRRGEILYRFGALLTEQKERLARQIGRASC